MKTTTVSVHDVINNRYYCPLDISVIPNYMGINLCSTESVTWTQQADGQLVSLTINFDPHTPNVE
jgi:hypothetical protein